MTNPFDKTQYVFYKRFANRCLGVYLLE